MSSARGARGMYRVFVGLVAAALIATGLTAVFGQMAEPDVAAAAEEIPMPPPLLQRDENVVTSDPIPTVQIDNGYVWAQTTIGSTVYAVGDFDNARAPLASPGTELTARSNVLAYDINTGELLPFAPLVNGVVKAVAASPDGSRIYIGGSFTSVNGQARWSIAALDAVTGQLVPGFSPAIGGTGVYGLVAHGDMVYAGGLFTQGNGTPRKNLAAFHANNGALMPWAPQTDRQVDAMVADPDGEKIIVAGRFSETNGNTAMRGAVAVDRSTGAVDADWELPQTVKNGWGSGGNAGRAGIFALAADDSAVYGTGWVYAGVTVGNLEGTFAAEAGTGEVRWIADCLGDHYGVHSTGTTVYTTSHTHACSTMGLHPEQSPRKHRYVEAYTADARGLLGRNPHAGGTYQNWEGTPGPSAYNWFPDFLVGTTSGMGQAGLSITGAGDTISIAGEFVGVNNGRFEGIVRFATDPPGGAQDGPRLSGSDWQPSADSFVPGRTRVTIPANWDRDDLDITYELHRAGTSAPVATKVAQSTWWDRSSLVLEDPTGTPGQQHTYTVIARDGDGNTATSAPVTVTVASGVASEYVTAILADGPQLYYPLGDTPQDWAGANPPTFGSGVSAQMPGIQNSSTGHSSFNGASDGRVSSSRPISAGQEFSTELWFRTTSSRGGKLIGYGNSHTGTSSSYDRHVYMSDNGRLIFGVYPEGVRTVESTPGYNDGQWHHVVAMQGTSGMALYIDGALAASDQSVTTAQAYNGHWRIGGDNLNGWPGRPSSDHFTGDIDEVAVYDRALSSAQVSTHYGIGHGKEAPTAAFAVTTDGLDAQLDASASTGNGGATIVEHRWDFGDGSDEVSGETATHTYAATGSYPVTLTVVDTNGLSATATRTVDVTGPNAAPSAEISTSVSGLTVTADGSGSSDPDGQIVAYDWDWGDGESSTGQLASHAYPAAGDYTVTLTVTDDRGGTAQTTARVTATHADATAQFTVQVTGLAVEVDAADSAAADGATLSYSWDWGDGTAASEGRTTSHSYTEGGVYDISLTVTDSLGATDTVSQSVTVTSEVFAASDAFERTVASGWGSADVGGAWTPSSWGSAAMSVGDGVGTMVLAPGVGRDMLLAESSLVDSGTAMSYTLDEGPSTGSLYIGMKSRYDQDGHAYRSLVWHRDNGSMWLVIQRDGTVLATLPVSGQWAAGDTFQVRTEVVGDSSATIRMKVWPEGTAEPAGWQLETTDSSAQALTGSGSSSVYLYRAGSSTGQAPVHVDDYRLSNLADSPGEPAENVAPVADFTSSTSGLELTVDASTSTDEDGTITSYVWDFGDGTTDTGVTASHEYTEAVTYPVALTVTDDAGATHTESQSVTVTSEVFAASDAFERTVASGWGSADVGGAWTPSSWGSAAMSVGDGVGTMVLAPGVGRDMLLAESSLVDSGTAMSYTLDEGPSTGSLYIGMKSRYDQDGHAYRSLVWHRDNGSMWLVIQRDGTVLATLPVSGQWAAGDTFQVRTEVVGDSSATIRMKVWPEGTAEPAGWQLETTDSSAQALTGSGSSSVYLYRAGSSTGQAPVHVDDYRLSNLAETAPAAQQVALDQGEEDGPAEEEASSDTEAAEKAGPAEAPASEKGPAQPTGEKKAPVEPTGPDTKGDPDPAEDAGVPTEKTPEAAEPETADPSPAQGQHDAQEPAAVDEEPEPAPESSEPEDEAAADTPPASEEPPEGAQKAEEATRPEEQGTVTGSHIEDRFDRTAESGWGETDPGGAWSLADDSEATLSVADGAGRLELTPGSTADVLLDGPPLTAETGELTFRIEEGADPGGTEVGFLLGQDGPSPYRMTASMRPDGSIWLTVRQGEDLIAEHQLDDLAYEPGNAYTLAVSSLEHAGTALAVKLWEAEGEEPADWQLTITGDELPSPPDSDGKVGVTASRGDGAGEQVSVVIDEFAAVSSS